MTETRKIVAILAADVVGYSRVAGADEDRTLARLRALGSDLLDPTIAVHHGRIVKRTGGGALVEFPALSTLCAAPAWWRMARARAMRVYRPSGGANFVSASILATSSRRATAI